MSLQQALEQQAQRAAAAVVSDLERSFDMSVLVTATRLPPEAGGGTYCQVVIRGPGLPDSGIVALLANIIDAHQIIAKVRRSDERDLSPTEQMALAPAPKGGGN